MKSHSEDHPTSSASVRGGELYACALTLCAALRWSIGGQGQVGNSACPSAGPLPLAFMPFSAGPAGARQGPVGLHNSLSYPRLHCSASHVYFLSADSKEFTCRWRSKIPREGWTQRCPGVREAQPMCVQRPPGQVLPGQTLWCTIFVAQSLA